MPVLDNPKFEKFVQSLISGMSQRQAYYQAYPNRKERWKPETVDNKASKLFNSDEIKARYTELQEATAQEAIMTRSERMIKLSEIAKDEEPTVQIKAIDTLNKMDGVYTNKVELSGSVDLSVDEKRQLAMQRLKELRADG